MTDKGQTISEEIKIQGLLDRYLQFRHKGLDTKSTQNHIDEDSLTAFIEGRLSEREMPLMLKHLVDCAFCLHVTSELVKLNAALTEDEAIMTTPVKEPTKVSDVLSGLVSRIFGSNDAAVFAHQEKEEEKEEKKDS